MFRIFSLIFRVAGAKQGLRAHDQFNLVKATLTLKPKVQP